MTGRLRRLTGPALIADHDKRIDQLERRLGTQQTDPGRSLRVRPASTAVLGLRPVADIPLGGIVEWQATDAYSYNLGDFFSVVSETRIQVPQDCIVHVDCNIAWGNDGGTFSPAGTVHLMEINGLEEPYLPDWKQQRATPGEVNNAISVTARLLTGTYGFHVVLSHNSAFTEKISLGWLDVELVTLL